MKQATITKQTLPAAIFDSLLDFCRDCDDDVWLDLIASKNTSFPDEEDSVDEVGRVWGVVVNVVVVLAPALVELLLFNTTLTLGAVDDNVEVAAKTKPDWLEWR